MVRFVVKQKFLAFSDDFIIYDNKNKPAYKVYGRLFTVGNKLSIYNIKNRDEIYIKQKLFKLLPQYHIYKNGVKLAIIKKEFTLFRPKFIVEVIDNTLGQVSSSYNYKIEGDLFNYNFNIKKEGRSVARVSKKFFSMRDAYAVDIVEGEDEDLLVSICIVIDQVHHDNNHNNN